MNLPFNKYIGWLFICLFLMGSFSVNAQEADSEVILTAKKFSFLVKSGHPVVMRSSLFTEEAEANLREARGSFDPVIYGDLNQKYFDGKEYYSLLQSGLRVPTWFGITLDAGMEDNRGTNLNPEDFTPAPDLWHAGLTVPLGQGLFIDKRRADLKKAKFFLEQNEAERILLVNEVLLESSEAYWNWFESYHSLKVAELALSNAKQRLEGVIQSAIRGDRPYIDTLEATIQVQNREAKRLESLLGLNNSKLYLETFLWKDGIIPLEILENAIPQERSSIEINGSETDLLKRLDSIAIIHPKLRAYRSQLQIQRIDLRLKREYLKPKIDLKYNALSSAANRNDLLTSYSMNNYNWGVKVSLPLFLRQERGQLKLANVKMEDLKFKYNNEIAHVSYKAQAARNKLDNSRKQVQLYEKTVNNYEKLYDSEIYLFERGESSLFLVNSREKSWLDAQLKLIELQSKNRIAKAELEYHLALFN